ncbi:SIS domain-containing protein [Streptomyces albus]|uniref:SIS domain-containing protein n=1 Tax=Streptomyces albus TaxID=1888 RepID=UPI0013B484C1|nr:SIS domain-containing protein [Streptomyces albus]MDI6410526.1 SIS domain-containing protein [Streptomyces albus]QID36863.1 SIS domain-containing protein [Streptomyces albus]
MDETAAQDGGRTATPGTATGRHEEAPTADRSAADDFFDAAIALLQQVRDGEGDAVREAGALLADTVAAGGRVFAFGAGHSSLPAQDTVYRAGGLAVMNLLNIPGAVGVDVRPATLGSALERVPGLAAAALDSSPARAGDLLVVISLSGRNALPVELAMNARALGLKVIGITSLAYSRETRSRHTTGTFLKDHCDLVVDSRIALGDAELTAEGVGAPFAPASTVVTSALMQAVVAEATCALARKGIEPPMLRSGNVDGGHDWNARVMDAYADRIFYR